MKTLALVLALFAAFVFVVAETNAQVYKWVDKDGVMHFTDTPTEGKYISPDSPPLPNQNHSNDGRADLDSLYSFLMDESATGKHTVGGSACYLCAAQIVQMVYASGIPVRKEFFDIMYGLKDRRRTVGGLLNQITRAGLIQGISLPSSGPCLTATFHSK